MRAAGRDRQRRQRRGCPGVRRGATLLAALHDASGCLLPEAHTNCLLPGGALGRVGAGAVRWGTQDARSARSGVAAEEAHLRLAGRSDRRGEGRPETPAGGGPVAPPAAVPEIVTS